MLSNALSHERCYKSCHLRKFRNRYVCVGVTSTLRFNNGTWTEQLRYFKTLK